VIGREFSPRLLESLCDEGVMTDAHVAELKRLEFIYERIGADGPRYVFDHTLTHEVAYEGLLVSRRRVLHEAVGQMLERQFADRLDGVLDRLAHHYSRTERSGKAVDYLSRFAETAVRGNANAEAARALEEALPHAERLPAEERQHQVLALVVRLVACLFYQGRAEEGRDLLLAHQPRVDAVRDPRLAGEYFFWLGHIAGHMGDSTGAVHYAARAIEEAERAGDSTTIGKARCTLAWEGFWTSRFAEGAEHARAAAAALEATEDWWWLGYALSLEAINQMSLGEFDAALRVNERGRTIARERHHPALQSYSAWMRGRIHAVRGDWEAAIAYLTESLDGSPEPLRRAYAMAWLGFAHREKGDHARAIALLEQAVASLTEFQHRRATCVFTGFLAGAHRSAGRVEEAREVAEGALALSDKLRYPWSVALARRELGRVALASGDLAGAESRLCEALEAFIGMDAVFEAAVTRLDLAELARRRGQDDEAARLLDVCRRSFTELGSPSYVARTEALARALDGMSRPGPEGLRGEARTAETPSPSGEPTAPAIGPERDGTRRS
jgi:tetratricopeptide (TPR) repeat protein